MSRDNRDHVVSFRVTEAEGSELDARATEEGMARADYCRAVLLNPGLIERLYNLSRGLAQRLLDREEFEQLVEEVEGEGE